MSDALAIKQKKAVRTTVAVLVFVVISVIAAIVLKFATAKPDLQAVLEANNVSMFSTPRAVPNVNLTQHDGLSFNTSEFAGQWNVVTFGYTYCPDICPTNMADMNIASKQLAELGLEEEVQFWMISVDPARDTVEQLALYVPYFNPDFIGLTGEINEISNLAMQLSAVFYQEGTGEGYTVAHSDNYAIIDPNGNFIALIRPPHKPSQISEPLAALINN